jgi:hypothetical protein
MIMRFSHLSANPIAASLSDRNVAFNSESVRFLMNIIVGVRYLGFHLSVSVAGSFSLSTSVWSLEFDYYILCYLFIYTIVDAEGVD